MKYFAYDIDPQTYLKICQGAQPVEQTTLPDEAQQVFVMSTDIADGLKEDLAWTSYILLRNTNAIAAVCHIDYHYQFIIIVINLNKPMVG